MPKIFIVSFFLLISALAKSQYDLDYGFNLGASNYLGDLGGREDKIALSEINFRKTGIATGVWARKRLHPLFSAKANLLFLRIAGVDSMAGQASLQDFILHFRSNIFELSAQSEFNFLRVTDLVNKGRMRTDFNAYLYAGAGVFYHRPKAFYNIEWVPLQRLGTEGQKRILVENNKGKERLKRSYWLIQPTLLFGLGFHFTVEKIWRIGLETGWRETFTDYLDDVSGNYVDPAIFSKDPLKLTPEEVQMAKDLSGRSKVPSTAGEPGSPRGNPKYKDAYIFAVFNFGYVVRGDDSDFERVKYKFRTRGSKKRKTRAKF